jgi:hypothetical protein
LARLTFFCLFASFAKWSRKSQQKKRGKRYRTQSCKPANNSENTIIIMRMGQLAIATFYQCSFLCLSLFDPNEVLAANKKKIKNTNINF